MEYQSKLRLLFISSLVILAGVFITTISFIPSGQDYSNSSKVRIIDGEDEWILQYDILNNEERDTAYSIQITIDSEIYKNSTVVKQGKSYSYIRHIYPQQLLRGEINFVVYKEGINEPIENVTYYIDLDWYSQVLEIRKTNL